MPLIHRALFTWFILLIFLVLLVLRLDQRIQWNWFIVFIPMWLYDNILLIYIIFNMISYCKNGRVSSLRREVCINHRKKKIYIYMYECVYTHIYVCIIFFLLF